MHLAVAAGDGAVLLQDHGGVVVKAGRPALEEGDDEHHPQLPGQGAEGLGRRPRDRLRLVEAAGILALAEIPAGVQLLQDDQLRPPGRGPADRLQAPPTFSSRSVVQRCCTRPMVSVEFM